MAAVRRERRIPMDTATPMMTEEMFEEECLSWVVVERVVKRIVEAVPVNLLLVLTCVVAVGGHSSLLSLGEVCVIDGSAKIIKHLSVINDLATYHS